MSAKSDVDESIIIVVPTTLHDRHREVLEVLKGCRLPIVALVGDPRLAESETRPAEPGSELGPLAGGLVLYAGKKVIDGVSRVVKDQYQDHRAGR